MNTLPEGKFTVGPKRKHHERVFAAVTCHEKPAASMNRDLCCRVCCLEVGGDGGDRLHGSQHSIGVPCEAGDLIRQLLNQVDPATVWMPSQVAWTRSWMRCNERGAMRNQRAAIEAIHVYAIGTQIVHEREAIRRICPDPMRVSTCLTL